MANTDLRADSALVTIANRFPPAAAALIAARMLNRHSPGEIGAAIEVLLDLLDLMGGDPDAENTTDAEDDFAISSEAAANTAAQTGCAISDPPDAGAWVEWHTMRGSQKRGPNILAGHEDDEDDDHGEDDDPAGGNVEDEAQINDVQPYTGPIACGSSRDIAEDRH